MWTQQESLDAPLDPVKANGYAYAGADPINNYDPTGQAVNGQCFKENVKLGAESGHIVGAATGAIVGGVTSAVAGFGVGASVGILAGGVLGLLTGIFNGLASGAVSGQIACQE